LFSLSRFSNMNTLIIYNIGNKINNKGLLFNVTVKYPASEKCQGTRYAISVETSWYRSRLQTIDIKVKIFHSINGDRKCREGLTRRFRIARGHALAGECDRLSGIPFPARRGSRVADIEPIANIEKRQSPALSDVMNTRKILLTLMSLPLPPVWSPYNFSVTVFL